MKYILTIVFSVIFVLSSCGQEFHEEIDKTYETFSVAEGTLTISDTLIASIEWSTTSTLAFKVGWRVSDIYVRPWEKVRKWQILAELSNQESSIQVASLWEIEQRLDNLSLNTNVVKRNIENLEKSTAKLYDKRLDGMDAQIDLLRNALEKAKQNLGNDTWSLFSFYITLANDYERMSTNLLYEGDKILGITTRFDAQNDAWENYLGIRVWNIQSDTVNKWGALDASRAKIRSYTESWVVITDINRAIQDLKDAYTNARFFGASMNHLLENSVPGGWLPEETLSAWINQWKSLRSDEQQSEAAYINWRNSILSMVPVNSSWSVRDKDIVALELELKNLQISRETLMAEKESKLREIQTNIATAETQKWQIGVEFAQTRMNNSLAQASLEYGILRAPFDGVILEKFIDVWNVVGIGVPIMKLSSLDGSLVKAYINNDTYRYTVWDSLSLHNIAYEESMTGTISLLQNEKDPLHNKNYTEITLLDANEAIGERVMLTLVRKKAPLQNGVIIPLESIITRYGPPWVLRIESGKAVFTLVEIIGSDLSFAEVIWIPENSIIITEGKENILDGEMLDRVTSWE
jgi:multidrug efflux pump subunit AcrA (membrane-fusion protein)